MREAFQSEPDNWLAETAFEQPEKINHIDKKRSTTKTPRTPRNTKKILCDPSCLRAFVVQKKKFK
jgi:hypothetical protein